MPKKGTFRKEIRRLKKSGRWKLVKLSMGFSRLQQRRGRYLKDRIPLSHDESILKASKYRSPDGEPLPQGVFIKMPLRLNRLSKNRRRKVRRGYGLAKETV
jgi:hypothetical protein